MTPRNIKIKQENRSKAIEYLKKAEDNYSQMYPALKSGNYNAAGTLAVQCAISSADAICVFEKGSRSVSQEHMDVCELVKSITLPEAAGKSNTLKKIIAKKNLIQYESRNIYKNEALEIVKLADRFYKWVQSVMSN
ncbi:MAG: HEPN domain-containing protein [bacterium]